jgi:hypothetical protein
LNRRRRKLTSGGARLWRVGESHSAIAKFAAVQQLVPSFDSKKFIAAECGDQHAASVRSPESLRTPSYTTGRWREDR